MYETLINICETILIFFVDFFTENNYEAKIVWNPEYEFKIFRHALNDILKIEKRREYYFSRLNLGHNLGSVNYSTIIS
jgi:hypothetical protein